MCECIAGNRSGGNADGAPMLWRRFEERYVFFAKQADAAKSQVMRGRSS